jgi:ParB-like chromosome segregation protein Spo0J
VDELTLLPGNPRTGDVDAIAASLEAFGQRKPIVARRADSTVLAGNHTLLAARQLGWDRIAVVWVDDDDITAKAYALADNRTAELGGYDDAELAALIAEVGAADASLLAATAWTFEDLGRITADLDAPAHFTPSDENPRLDQKNPITCPECGSTWLPS